MKKRFIPLANKSQVMFKLTLLKQGSLRVYDLVDKFLQLIANISNISEREMKIYFFNSLKREIKKNLPNFYEESTTFDALITRAAMLEAANHPHESKSKNIAASVVTNNDNNKAKKNQKNSNKVSTSPSTNKSVDSIRRNKRGEKIICQLCSENQFNNQCPLVSEFIKSKTRGKDQPMANVATTENEHQDITFAILDSGCTKHMTPKKSMITNIKECSTTVQKADGSVLTSKKVGDIFCKIIGKPLRLTNVLLIKELKNPLISIKELCDNQYEVNFTQDGTYSISKDNNCIIGKCIGKSYLLLIIVDNTE
jgi:hypothetical protein